MNRRLFAPVVTALFTTVAACSGEDGAAGPAGAKGAASDPAGASFDLVVPSKGVAGRELDVVLSAQRVGQDGLTVDFGDPLVTVSDVKVVGDGTLTAHLAIDPKAALGKHDVTITSSSGKVVGTGAFTVATGMDVSVVGGAAEQGGIFRARFVNNDPSNAFDTGVTGDGFFTPLEPNFVVQGTGVSLLSTDFMSITEAQITFLADPLATGAVAFAGANAPGGAKPTLTFSAPGDAVKIAPRAPTVLAAGTPASGVLGKSFETKLYKMNVAAAVGIASVDVVGTGGKIVPSTYVIGSKGKLSDLFTGGASEGPKTTQTFSFPVTTTANAGDYYFIVLDGALKGGAAADYGFDVRPSVTAATLIDEQAGAHSTTGAAQAIGALPAVIKGRVAVTDEVDVYRVNVPANATVELSWVPNLDGSAEIVAGTDFNASVYADLVARAGRVTIKNGGAAADHYLRIQGDGFGATQTGDYLFSLRVLP